MEKKPSGNRIKKIILRLVAIVLIAIIAFCVVLLATEYRPAAIEDVAVGNAVSLRPSVGDEISLVTWNVGFGCLYDGADFFMDGGKMVAPSDRAQTTQNLAGIRETLAAIDADVALLQETDENAMRSHHINEIDAIAHDTDYETAYATNFRALFVPYPIPPIGQVDSGLLTLSRLHETNAQRHSLPDPFSWPVRAFNLKRCLLTTRIDLEGTDKQLVLINLHLEAYDDGTGKAAQTQALLELMRAEYKKGNYVIAGGDFNQTFSNADISAYPTREGLWEAGALDVLAFADHFSCYMDPALPTCRSLDQPYRGADKQTFQYYVLDGFIVSDNLEVLEMRTLDYDFRDADHNPVFLKIRIP